MRRQCHRSRYYRAPTCTPSILPSVCTAPVSLCGAKQRYFVPRSLNEYGLFVRQVGKTDSYMANEVRLDNATVRRRTRGSTRRSVSALHTGSRLITRVHFVQIPVHSVMVNYETSKKDSKGDRQERGKEDGDGSRVTSGGSTGTSRHYHVSSRPDARPRACFASSLPCRPPIGRGCVRHHIKHWRAGGLEVTRTH